MAARSRRSNWLATAAGLELVLCHMLPTVDQLEVSLLGVDEPFVSIEPQLTSRVAVQVVDRPTYNARARDVALPASEVPSYDELRDHLMGAGLIAPPNLGHVKRQLFEWSQRGNAAVDCTVDTNLLQYRFVTHVRRWFDAQHPHFATVTGFCLPTGVAKELEGTGDTLAPDDVKRWTRPMCSGDARMLLRCHLYGQPALRARYQRMALAEYDLVGADDDRPVYRPPSARGDRAIVGALLEHRTQTGREPIMLSNDRGMVERCHRRELLALHVERPETIPLRVEASVTSLADALWTLALVFGVIRVRGMGVIGGVWLGKRDENWDRREVLLRTAVGQIEAMLSHFETQERSALDGALVPHERSSERR